MLANAERLAAAVKARRAELEMNQLEVWQNGGPSNTTLTDIENGRTTTLSRTTARKLDAGLRWPEGTARRIFDGEQRSTEVLRGYVAQAEISDEARAQILAILDGEQAPPDPPNLERGAS